MKKIVSILMICALALSINAQAVFAFDSGYTVTDTQTQTSDSNISGQGGSNGATVELGGTIKPKPKPTPADTSKPKTDTNTQTDNTPAKEDNNTTTEDIPIVVDWKTPDTVVLGTPDTQGKDGTPDQTLEQQITSGFTTDFGQLGLRGQYVKDTVIPGTPSTPGIKGVGEKIIKGIDILIFGLIPGEPDTTTVATPEQIAQREQQATYQEPIDISGEWHHVMYVKHWDWNIHQTKDASIADMTVQTPTCFLKQTFTKTGPYRATARAWCRWEYGHYELRTAADGSSYRVAVKDGEYDEYDLSRTKIYTFTIGYNDLGKPVEIPNSQATVVPVDELVE